MSISDPLNLLHSSAESRKIQRQKPIEVRT